MEEEMLKTIKVTIGEYIKILMKRKKMGLWELSSELKMSQSALHDRISGKRKFTKDQLSKIVEMLER